MARIFTKKGDEGQTERIDGIRVSKSDPLIEVNGTIDECNSLIGVARSFNTDERLDKILKHFQGVLLICGSEVIRIKTNDPSLFMTDIEIHTLENLIDELEKEIPPLTHFILPSGGAVSAHLHLARTAARKVERRLMTLKETESINQTLLAYFNRLSDTLFILARYAVHQRGEMDEIWKPFKK